MVSFWKGFNSVVDWLQHNTQLKCTTILIENKKIIICRIGVFVGHFSNTHGHPQTTKISKFFVYHRTPSKIIFKAFCCVPWWRFSWFSFLKGWEAGWYLLRKLIFQFLNSLIAMVGCSALFLFVTNEIARKRKWTKGMNQQMTKIYRN